MTAGLGLKADTKGTRRNCEGRWHMGLNGRKRDNEIRERSRAKTGLNPASRRQHVPTGTTGIESPPDDQMTSILVPALPMPVESPSLRQPKLFPHISQCPQERDWGPAETGECDSIQINAMPDVPICQGLGVKVSHSMKNSAGRDALCPCWTHAGSHWGPPCSHEGCPQGRDGAGAKGGRAETRKETGLWLRR